MACVEMLGKWLLTAMWLAGKMQVRDSELPPFVASLRVLVRTAKPKRQNCFCLFVSSAAENEGDEG